MENRDELYVVVGAEGFLGKTFVSTLSKHGVPVIALGRHHFSCTVENISLAERSAWTEIADLYDSFVVIYAAWASYPRTKYDGSAIEYEIKNNIAPMTDFFLREMLPVKSKVSTAIFLSSAGEVYGELKNHQPVKETHSLSPITPYGEGKQMGEKLFFQHAAVFVKSSLVLRLSNPYGIFQLNNDDQGVIAQLVKCGLFGHEFIRIGALNTVRDFFYAEDLVEALLQRGKLPLGPHVFNVGSGAATSLKRLILLVEDTLNTSISLSHGSRMFKSPSNNVTDTSKFNEVFGNWNKTTLGQGIKLLANHIMAGNRDF